MKMFIIPLLILFLAGCATVPITQGENLTVGMVKTKIVKGVTTQNEILEVFGAPNVITKNKTGNEVWTYDRIAVETNVSDSYGTLILLGGTGSRASSSTRTFTLMLEFNEQGVVKDYSYRSSQF